MDGNPSAIDGFTGNTNYYLDEAYGLDLAGEHGWGRPSGPRCATRAGSRGRGCCGRSTRHSRRPCSTGSSRRALAVREETAADIRRTTGNIAFGSGDAGSRVLIHGFLVWVGPVAGRSAPWKAWAAGSEAIHRTSGDLIFLNDLQEAAEAVA